MVNNMMKIFVNMIPFFVVRSTDTDYMRNFSVCTSDLNASFYFPKDYFWGMKENILAVLNKLFSILGIKYHFKYKIPKEILNHEFNENNFDLIYSQSYYPQNQGSVPVFFETTFWESGDNSPYSESQQKFFLEETVSYHKWILSHRCLINLKSERELQTAKKYFPDNTDQFVSLPFLLPGIKPMSVSNIELKHKEDSPLKILFVGGQAIRKGLPLLIEAYKKFRDEYNHYRIELHIVSGYTDGKISVPENYDIIEHGKLSHVETQCLFRQCHIFAMISQKESYGLVYVEALANGCVVIARDFFPQKEIIDFGNLGFLALPGDLLSVYKAIKDACCMGCNERKEIGIKGLEKFVRDYSYENVVPRYKAAFDRCFKLSK